VPPPSSADAEARLKAQRTKDTGLERLLRSKLHRQGLRFQLYRPVPGTRRKADLSFVRARVAVFVDGCFWHGCPDHGTWPKANAVWWRTKIEANRVRDLSTNELLTAAGWGVIRVWEHALKADPDACAARVMRAVGRARRVSLRVANRDRKRGR
jgi:DNA mismatch endonuclease, patch repair protein